ncbi:MAG: HD domain-containing protein [Candidatus Kaelpia aquatica]|nr:HD domain-containing protein [Candidatus Kaelpia aquatica]
MKVDKDYENLVKETLYLLSITQDLDEKGKYEHGVRVALMSEKIAEEVLPQERDLMFFAGLVHDIGGLGSRNHILHHPDLLAQIQDPDIFEHPYRGVHLIRMFPVLFQGQYRMSDYIFEHHEWWKGVGYPRQYKKNEILLGGRILRAADAFDIYSRHGQNKSEINPQSAINVLESNEELDPDILNILKEIIKDKEFMGLYLKPQDMILEYVRSKDLNIILNHRDEDDLFAFIGYLIDFKIDSNAMGHSEGDTHYSVQIAKALNLPEDEVTMIRRGGYLHDIGKLSIPHMVLNKPAWLTEQEWQIVKKHSAITVELLDSIPSFKKYVFAGYHHERWDGKGYHQGLKGEEIPLGARIISVADALDAMTSKRTYRPVLTFKEALKELKSNAGTQFDPKIIEETVRIYK